jgi:Mor family transcriptional regulator
VKHGTVDYYGIHRAPEFLQQLADHAAQVLISRTTIDDLTAVGLGQEIAARIAQVYSGTRVRIPSGTWNGRSPAWCVLSMRDLAIYRMYNGRNWRDVCSAYNISRQHLTRVIRRVHDHLHRIHRAANNAPIRS